MLVYLLYVSSPILVYLLLSIFSRPDDKITVVNKKTYIFLCGVIIFLMIGLRSQYNGSADTSRYLQNWIIIRETPNTGLNNLFESIDFEKGYILTVFLLTRVFKDPQWLLVFSGAFFAITICNFVKENCDSSPFGFLAFNCLGSFNFMVQGLRQAIAINICLWALEQIKKKHYIKTAILILLAASFHASAYVFVVVIVFSMLKLDYKGIFCFSLCVVSAIIFLPQLFKIMGSFIEDDYSNNAAAESGGIVAILIYTFIIIFSLVYGDKKEKFFPLYMYLAMVGLCCMIMRNSVAMIAERVSHYFAFGEMAILERSVKKISDGTLKKIIQIVIVILLFAVAAYKASYSSLIPYKFFWEQ